MERGREAEKDNWRLRYHFTPPMNWMNDPNGFSYYDGYYHLFYQYHPKTPYWDDIHWGHARSKDLVRWEDLPIALAPSEPYDRDGCFSGSAIEKDGKLYLMYTGNIWTGGNRDTDLLQSQCLAISEDGVHFEKFAGNPVIREAPEGDIHPYHFRDPKVWRRGDQFYCVLGSRTKTQVGQILLYRSPNLTDWEFVGVAARGTSADRDGFMWECPDLFTLGGQDVLVLSPQGVKPEGEKFRNLHQAGYMLGRFDEAACAFEHGAFHMLDYGFDYYAPQTMEDPEGRRIVIAWMAMWESEMPERERGWAGAMTLPRVMTLERGEIRCRPLPELRRLRGEAAEYRDIDVTGTVELDGIAGERYELELDVDLREATRAGVKIRANEDNGEETVLLFQPADGTVTLDRSRAGKGPGGVRKAPVRMEDGRLHVRLFVDASSVEAFLQDGEKVMTARIYPEKGSVGVKFFAEGVMRIVRARKWELIES